MTTTLTQSASGRMAPKGAGSEPALLDIVKGAEVVPLHALPEDESGEVEPPLYQARRKI